MMTVPIDGLVFTLLMAVCAGAFSGFIIGYMRAQRLYVPQIVELQEALARQALLHKMGEEP